ncbi:hypothetical protein EBZ39_17065 [bacterium]|nr:hypothetical protein [bacterium]
MLLYGLLLKEDRIEGKRIQAKLQINIKLPLGPIKPHFFHFLLKDSESLIFDFRLLRSFGD